MRVCTDCGGPPNELGKGQICRPCLNRRAREWQKKNKERHRHNQLKRKFGISLEEYKRMHEAQNGVCAICFEPCSSGNELAVDHDHKTNKVRGLLCGNCNRGIGNLRESPAILYRAIEYLNKHRSP